MMPVIIASARFDGVVATCAALLVARASYYRHRRIKLVPAPRPSPARALAVHERTQVLAVLNDERFVDLAPREVYAQLLDEKTYVCSVRTMYRVLADAGEVRERRDQLRHPAYAKPELLATAPNQVWTWDITKLRMLEKWSYLYLYVILDLFSRYVVGWMLARAENGTLAKRLVEETCDKHGIVPGTLTIHNDRGTPMTSRTFTQKLIDLDVAHSFSRPQVSDDNPFSEAQFKTLKYRPTFPDRFGGYEHTHTWCREFFPWYCDEHRHSALALLTPADVYFGRAAEVLAERQRVLDAAYAAHPERFVRRPPTAGSLPTAVWINPPSPAQAPSEPEIH